MKSLSTERTTPSIDEQRRLIMRQQNIAAALHRNGQPEKARAARGKLLALLNQLDLMEAFGLPPASTARHTAAH
jgi:hypothetical protein